MATFEIRARVAIEVGARFYYDCPDISDSSSSQDFFRRNKGKYGTVVGFTHTPFLPLNVWGRVPGMYINTRNLIIKFDGDDAEHQLNTHHIVLLESTGSLTPDVKPGEQRVSNFPVPIEFYPADTVRMKTTGVIHNVACAAFEQKNNNFFYQLDPTEEEMAAYHERRKEEGCPVLGSFAPNPKFAKRDDIELVRRGNVFRLYEDPRGLSFESEEAEHAFWYQAGIALEVGEFAFREDEQQVAAWEKARQALTNGEADAASLDEDGALYIGFKGRYQLFRLHECFAEHRERVRALSLRQLTASPAAIA